MAYGPLSPKPEIEQQISRGCSRRNSAIGKPSLATAPGLRFCTNTSARASIGAKQRLVGGFGEIEHHRFLAAVEPDEIAALAVHEIVIAAREIAFRPLDLDDARAGIGEPAGAHRRRDRLFERDDEEAGERKGFTQYDLGSPSTCSAM